MGADLISRCDDNYWETMARLAEAVSGDPRVQEDGLLLASCRSPVGFFNCAFLLPSSTRSTFERLTRALEFFADQGVPFVVRTRHAITPDIAEAAREVGLTAGANMPIMALPTLGAVPPPPDDLEIERVTDQAGLTAHTEVVAAAFSMPLELARGLFTPATIADPDTEVFVARSGGEAVATSLVSVTGDMAGIYNVATIDRARRRGLGEALTWWAVQRGAAMGASSASLQASEMGRPVYERMGFDIIDDYLQYTGG